MAVVSYYPDRLKYMFEMKAKVMKITTPINKISVDPSGVFVFISILLF